MKLADKIRAVLIGADNALVYTEIEAAVGRRANHELGIALGRLLIARQISVDRSNWGSHYPAYWIGQRPTRLRRVARTEVADWDFSRRA